MTASVLPPGVFCSHGPRALRLTEIGPLQGISLAVKDLFHLRGERNTAGNPAWWESHGPAETTALALQKLLDAGAEFVGFTHTDELAYALQGSNFHYGTAENPRVPGHVCGGSSMGSAAAVAAGLADAALGTDTGGSVRVPASYCGLFGMRPTHGVVSSEGLIPLAPPFDTVGWFTRNVPLLQTIGERLLPPDDDFDSPRTAVLCRPLWAFADLQIQSTFFEKVLPVLHSHFSSVEDLPIPEASMLDQLGESFRVLQGAAIASTHGDWLRKNVEHFEPAIAQRIHMALDLQDAEIDAAQEVRLRWQGELQAWLADRDCVLLLPSTATTAPAMGADQSALRGRLLQLTSVAGLWGAPQCHLPAFTLSESDGEMSHEKPSGFSVMMRPGCDRQLLKLVNELDSVFNE